jgi:hypothetical protein
MHLLILNYTILFLGLLGVGLFTDKGHFRKGTTTNGPYIRSKLTTPVGDMLHTFPTG